MTAANPTPLPSPTSIQGRILSAIVREGSAAKIREACIAHRCTEAELRAWASQGV